MLNNEVNQPCKGCIKKINRKAIKQNVIDNFLAFLVSLSAGLIIWGLTDLFTLCIEPSYVCAYYSTRGIVTTGIGAVLTVITFIVSPFISDEFAVPDKDQSANGGNTSN